MPAAQILVYAAVLVFLVAVALRAVRYHSTPVHLRWELYPVAHEKGRAHYGGSIFEEPDWWLRPRQVDRLGELREMAAEILLLKGVRHHNPRLWVWSWPFHFGLYVLAGYLALLAVGGVSILAGSAPDGGWLAALRVLTAICGWAGMALTLVGALGLLARRAGDRNLRRFSAPAEYFNLVLFIAVMALGLVVHALADPGFGRMQEFAAALIGFRAPERLGIPLATGIAAAAALIAYIPLTRMVHFVAKYFLYHDVRWSDAPNPRGGKLEQRLMQAFNFGVSWRAGHIAGDGNGRRSWAQVATEEKK